MGASSCKLFNINLKQYNGGSRCRFWLVSHEMEELGNNNAWAEWADASL
jgi:hypothetical protein